MAHSFESAKIEASCSTLSYTSQRTWSRRTVPSGGNRNLTWVCRQMSKTTEISRYHLDDDQTVSNFAQPKTIWIHNFFLDIPKLGIIFYAKRTTLLKKMLWKKKFYDRKEFVVTPTKNKMNSDYCYQNNLIDTKNYV